MIKSFFRSRFVRVIASTLITIAVTSTIIIYGQNITSVILQVIGDATGWSINRWWYQDVNDKLTPIFANWGNVWIKKTPTNPAYALTISGNTDVGWSVKHSNDTRACNASTEWSIRYNTTTNVFEWCDGTNWGPMCNLTPDPYSWKVDSSWSACSVRCGGWTQAKNVTCQRYDWVVVADSFCRWVKPLTSQACNTSVCVAENWVCWSSHETAVSVAPTTGLCSVWTATAVTGSGTWIWKCNGNWWWTDAICGAWISKYYAATIQAVSAFGWIRRTNLGNNQHCVISRVYGDTERSSWNLSQLTVDTSICETSGFSYVPDPSGDGWTWWMGCNSYVSSKAWDWIIEINDEWHSTVARADVICTNESSLNSGSFLIGAVCRHNWLNGIIDNAGCCIVWDNWYWDKRSNITGNFWSSCNP